jgi:hypothetical protein
MEEVKKKKRLSIIDKIIIFLSIAEVIIITVLTYHFIALFNLK